jgi:hypothetical protein
MPSYSLCPTERGKNRVELAEINTGNPLDEMASVYAMTSMIMANYSLTPGIPTDKSLMDLMDAKNKVMKDNNAGTKGCNTCHDDGNPKTLNDLLLAKPISPFSTKSPNVRRFKGDNFHEQLVFTTQPGETPNGKIAESLPDICKKIFCSRRGLLKENPFLEMADLKVSTNLCRRIKDRSFSCNTGGIDADAQPDRPIFELGHSKLGNKFVISVTNNQGSVPLTIDIARFPFANFLCGDQKDFVANIKATGGTCQTFVEGNPLKPGKTCTVNVAFDTGPPDKDQKPNPDFGNWDIVTRITFTNPKDSNRIDLLPTVTVEVGD